MPNEMNGQYDWTPGGKELLMVIEQYVSDYGGNHAILKAITEDERRYRHRLICRYNGGRHGNFRKRKRVVLINNRVRRVFKDLDKAAEYLGKTNNYLRNAICQPFKVSGWRVDYVK